ncbi:hypothetical protein AJ80_04769 [Polytolypa hystricis UAMH7299]|uniref:Serine hydrolase domain-containing protein n=1 Tax=Polytolypa hystricis (strain UAMH7299) TaxID=1447883 RepID=A0A2B7Y8Q8_POLH7|nr:hypothetical protein AJ80_04769 [Polytolypa hystricis UAMH7299]
MSTTTPDPTLHLPRLLCLHGGGTNARIFRMQTRVILAHLKSHFRFCFVDAPYTCDARDPRLLAVYGEYQPFRRWLRWMPEHEEIDAQTAVGDIEKAMREAMEEDDRCGATGQWVGLLGFSQGAKMAASLLFREQVRTEERRRGRRRDGVVVPGAAGAGFRFAVLMAGRGPFVSLEPGLVVERTPRMADAGQISTKVVASVRDEYTDWEWTDVLRLPTIHVHGLKDPGLAFHRQLLDDYCEKGSARLVEWDGEHRLPTKIKDVEPVVRHILEVARETGVLPEEY